jgi:two-component system phosphate regulon sensor histidine kinase PhoR
VKLVRHHQLVDIWRRCRETNQEQVSSYEFGQYHLFLQVVAIPFTNILEGNVLLLFQDLTQVRRLETIRRDFISNISHELRTPLASLKALVETLLGGALDDPPLSRRFLKTMENEVDSLTQMVNELLELTRIESGRVPLQLEEVSPTDLLNSAIERLYLQAERAGLKITVDIPEGLPDVLADPPRLEQVLVNLLHNAIKFTPEGGEIKMAVQETEEGILFVVQDTGVGIPDEDLPRIFERFFKADRARAGGGTGLGLAIARHLVQAHRGNIWAESVEGRGSTFFFNIPIVE